MFYGNELENTREMFFASWKKYQLKQPLLPLEQQIVDVILLHPEYQKFFEDPRNKEKNFFPELGMSNPFLHLGLHLALREQIATNRPEGIAKIYQQLLMKYRDRLAVEHKMIEVLSECLWIAQKNGSTPDEAIYIKTLAGLLN